MKLSWVIHPSRKERRFADGVRFVAALALILFCVVLFGLVLPALFGGKTLPFAEIQYHLTGRQETIDAFWADYKPSLFSTLNWGFAILLVGLGVWGVLKVLMVIFAKLDREGHFDRLIASHHHRHDQR